MIYLTLASDYLTTASSGRIQSPVKKPIFSVDVAVQTEAVVSFDSTTHAISRMETDAHDDQESTLSATDLASILKWSKDISSDINLSSGWLSNSGSYCSSLIFLLPALQRLTEIATGLFFHAT